ncbi:MAG: twin-arginine translocase TatA/TatE family subunit [Acidimicrobiia bacterium]|nr:twin-arginine translocase TatA/TatE family subunit [Acidimicrobiia bacterium]MBT8250524.1 twin-arginine translocase TatA/TatE family subunit [Acidimicrobiia bacterium]NNC43000.1 twin-arginine translocase TatA/TatE family subunit [Acidimicrobiia bacterium]NND13536.1 twin-arginine translocase TatA/TatE family subunit [Acidimicrobiia bacterium]NNL28688.1 twin-arginine translocase TatA/TatE family subunit [Acidimicrobiia bacterium]
MNFQGWEWIILLVALLLLFGAKKLPELARSLGASSKEFKKGLEDGARDGDAEKVAEADASTEDS